MLRRPAKHGFGFRADGDNLAGFLIYCHDRGLIDDNPLTAHINQGIGGAEIKADIVGEISFERL